MLSIRESISINNTICAVARISSRWALFSLPSFNRTSLTTPSLFAHVSIMQATGQWFRWVSAFTVQNLHFACFCHRLLNSFFLVLFVGTLCPISTKIYLLYVERFSNAFDSKYQLMKTIPELGLLLPISWSLN